MNKKVSAGLATLAVPALLPAVDFIAVPQAAAETATATLSVTAVVQPSCTVSANPVNFGAVKSGEAGNATGAVRVACTTGTSWTAAADGDSGAGGGGSGGDIVSRSMRGGSGKLSYLLFTDSSLTQPWGDGSGGTALLQGKGKGSAELHRIHARILPDRSGTPSGAYSDLVRITIRY